MSGAPDFLYIGQTLSYLIMRAGGQVSSNEKAIFLDLATKT